MRFFRLYDNKFSLVVGVTEKVPLSARKGSLAMKDGPFILTFSLLAALTSQPGAALTNDRKIACGTVDVAQVRNGQCMLGIKTGHEDA